jgi:hypothetical protein
MNLSFPVTPTAVIAQAWGNVDPIHYSVGRHMGLDLAAWTGSPIHVACDGTVETVNLVGAHGYGRHVIVRHDDGFVTLYAHLLKVFVQESQRISSGFHIGAMGGDPNDDDKNDGYSTGPHLHWELALPKQPTGDFVKTFLGYTVDPIPELMRRYATAPTYSGKVVSPRGVRVRSDPVVNDKNALYGIGKNTTIKIAETKQIGDDLWARHWTMRAEWSAVKYQGDELMELTPLSEVPPSPEPLPTVDEVPIRLNEIERMTAYLNQRRSEL